MTVLCAAGRQLADLTVIEIDVRCPSQNRMGLGVPDRVKDDFGVVCVAR